MKSKNKGLHTRQGHGTKVLAAAVDIIASTTSHLVLAQWLLRVNFVTVSNGLNATGDITRKITMVTVGLEHL
jgi:hypothetical protein